MKSIVVTGGSGKAGRAAIRELLDHGYAVMNVDLTAPAEPLCHFLKADLNDLGQAIDALSLAAGTIDRRRMPFGRTTAVLHLAGIPAPGLAPDATIFQNNLMTTYNVFSAATRLGLRARGVGVERDHLRPALHPHSAARGAGGGRARAGPGNRLRARQGAVRADGA